MLSALYVCALNHGDRQGSLAAVVYTNPRRLHPYYTNLRPHEGHLTHNQGKYRRQNLIFFKK